MLAPLMRGRLGLGPRDEAAPSSRFTGPCWTRTWLLVVGLRGAFPATAPAVGRPALLPRAPSAPDPPGRPQPAPAGRAGWSRQDREKPLQSGKCAVRGNSSDARLGVIDALSALRRLRRLGADLLDASAVRGEEDD